MHICVYNLTIIGSDNGLSPGRRQAIIWNNAGILLIGPLGRNFSELLIEIQTFSFKKKHLKVSAKLRPFCLGLNELYANIIHKNKSHWDAVKTLCVSTRHSLILETWVNKITWGNIIQAFIWNNHDFFVN